MIALGISMASFYILWQAYRQKLSMGHMAAMLLLASLAGLLGMRVFHIVIEAPGYYVSHPGAILNIGGGGYVSWGAMVGAATAAMVYLRRFRLPAWRYLDAIALGLPIVFFFVRLGCLGAGCCYDTVADWPIYLVFPTPAPPAGSTYPGFPLHAVQLYSMMNALFLFVALHLAARRQKRPGTLILWFVIGYGLLRLGEELLRGDLGRGVYFGWLSTGDIMSLFLIGSGLIVYRRRLKAG